ncbi:MAG: hypothetical protein PHO92_02285 [Candidatus Peribacteraceae bacterium]|nr:hypothetical protein [Candidatus Peribacteraceae bacterium]
MSLRTATGPVTGPSGDETKVEAPKSFIPTPERLSQYLEMNIAEVDTALRSVEGRETLYSRIVEHEEDLKQLYPDFNPNGLREQLDLIGDVLRQKEAYMKDVSSPEKKGLFRRAWDRVKGFAKRHPIVTALLAIAGIAAAVAGGFYLTGNWELFLTSTGLSKVFGSVDAAGEMITPTPYTPMAPGAGELHVPAPADPIPGAEIPI